MQQNSSKASGSLVCGIISLAILILWIPLTWALPLMFFFAPIIGIVTGIVGVVLGVGARKETSPPPGTATAGFIMSIIGLALNAIFFISCGSCALYAYCMYGQLAAGASAGACSSLASYPY